MTNDLSKKPFSNAALIFAGYNDERRILRQTLPCQF